MTHLPNPDKPEPKKKLITKASRRGGKNTKKEKLNFVLSRFRVFVMKTFYATPG